MDEARRLSAIMFTDVVGFTARMGADERGTLTLMEELNAFLRARIEGHGGRIWKFMGDATLSEFPAVVEAVTCALEIQSELAEKNSKKPENERIELRIGLHAGDVREREGDLFGDTVNVASRLEPLAPAGGVCISRVVYDTVRRAVPFQARFLGKKRLKGVREPVKVFLVAQPEAPRPGLNKSHWGRAGFTSSRAAWLFLIVTLLIVAVALAAILRNRLSDLEGKGHTPARSAPAVEGEWKNSVAVLPFKNISPDPQQEYFCDGITEQIITSLSQIPDLKVIARTSVMTYKNSDKDVRAIAEELGVANVLEGSVRKSGDRIRVTAQLVKAEDGALLWTRDYDRESKDVFTVQEDVAKAIAEALQLTVGGGPLLTAQDIKPASMEAYEYYLKARHQTESVYMITHDENDFQKAMEYGRKAVEIDPNYALGYCGLALICEDRRDITNDDGILELEFECVRRAYELDPHSAVAASGYGLNLVRRGKTEEGFAICKRAIGLHPNDSMALLCMGNVLNFLGLYEDALAYLDRSTKLDPRNYWAFDDLGSALASVGQPERALKTYETALSLQPADPPTIASCAWASLLANRLQEADGYISSLERYTAYEGESKRWRAAYWASAGNREKALALAAPKDPIVLALLGRRDEAIAALGEALNVRRRAPGADFSYLPLARQRFYDSLRSDPRFLKILEGQRRVYEQTKAKYGSPESHAG